MIDKKSFIQADTRAQALKYGALVDVTEYTRIVHLRYPVALTRGVWSRCVEAPKDVSGQDRQTTLRNFARALRDAIDHDRGDGSRFAFSFPVPGDEGRSTLVPLKAVCRPDDDGSPCLTVMLREEAEPGTTAMSKDAAARAPSRLFLADTYWSDWQLFQRLGLRAFRRVSGEHNVGTTQIAGHQVEVRVNCMPAQFWRFRITGPTFRGELSTGSGTLADYWWAVEAVVQGDVRITCPGDIRCRENNRTYALAGRLTDERNRDLRQLLADGMLVVDSRP